MNEDAITDDQIAHMHKSFYVECRDGHNSDKSIRVVSDRRDAAGNRCMDNIDAAVVIRALLDRLASSAQAGAGWVTVTEDEATWPKDTEQTTLYERAGSALSVNCGIARAETLRRDCASGHFIGGRHMPWPTATPRAAGGDGLRALVAEAAERTPNGGHTNRCTLLMGHNDEGCGCKRDEFIAKLRAAAGGG